MDDKLNFLSGEPAQVEETTPQASFAEASEAKAEPEALAAAPEQPQAAETALAVATSEPTAPVPATVEPGHVPIAALLDEREQRQALKKELDALKARAEPPEPPTPEQQSAASQYAMNLRFSRKFAEREYGAETIAKVHDWASAKCDADPAFNSAMMSSDDPYEAAFQAFNRERVLTEVKPDDLDAFLAWKAASGAAPAQAVPSTDNASTPLPGHRIRQRIDGQGSADRNRRRVAFGALFPS